MIGFSRRRLTFQLTPLLDLLLIVIFAQYMEVQSTSREEIAEAAAVGEKVESLEEERDRLDRERTSALLRATQLDEQLQTAVAENAGMRERLTRESEQRERLTERFSEMFRVNQRVLAAALDPNDPKFEGLSEDELRKLRQRLDEIVSAKGGEALEHLVTYEELRKRADVWKIRVGNVDESGRVSVRAGERDESFKARSAEDFAETLAKIRNRVEQPKSHVIILLTYDSRRAELLSRNLAREGLSRFVTRMRGDGATRFFWAEIGYDPRVLGLPES